MKNIRLITCMFLMILLIIPLINAFGVTTFYWDDKPLVMYPGQTKDVFLKLQNVDGNKDVTLKAEMKEGSEIVTLIDPSNEYFLPFGSKDVDVNIRVRIPENVPLGNKYNIFVSFKDITETKEGNMLQIASSVGTSIPVLVGSVSEVPVETPASSNEIPKTSSLDYLWVLIIIIIVIIGLIILFKEKRKKR